MSIGPSPTGIFLFCSTKPGVLVGVGVCDLDTVGDEVFVGVGVINGTEQSENKSEFPLPAIAFCPLFEQSKAYQLLTPTDDLTFQVIPASDEL